MKLESVCNAHHDDITKIKTVMVEKYPKSSSVFSMKPSPRKLNPTGEKLFAAINGEQFLKDNKESLFGYISPIPFQMPTEQTSPQGLMGRTAEVCSEYIWGCGSQAVLAWMWKIPKGKAVLPEKCVR